MRPTVSHHGQRRLRRQRRRHRHRFDDPQRHRTSQINTSNITSTGTQTYAGTVTLGTDTNLTGSTVTFNSPVVGADHALTVTGNAVFGDAAADTVTGLTTLNVTGTSQINTSNITSTGAQTYAGIVTLGADTSLTGSTVTFNSRSSEPITP